MTNDTSYYDTKAIFTIEKKTVIILFREFFFPGLVNPMLIQFYVNSYMIYYTLN